MTLFLIGIIIFAIGFIIRFVFKIKMYKDYNKNGRTDILKKEINDRYRPLIFMGLAIETIGCIILIIYIAIK